MVDDKKQYLDTAGLTLYDEKIKAYLKSKDGDTLTSANNYTDSKIKESSLEWGTLGEDRGE